MGTFNQGNVNIAKATSYVLAARNAVNADLVAFSDGSARAVANAIGRAACFFLHAAEELTGASRPFDHEQTDLPETVAGKYDALRKGYDAIIEAAENLKTGKIDALDGMKVVDDAVDAYMTA